MKLSELSGTGFPRCEGRNIEEHHEIPLQLCHPCFGGAGEDETSRTDTVVLACTHFPLLLDHCVTLAPWPVDWIDPAPAIARRVSDLLGPSRGQADHAGAEMFFTSNRPHTLSRALMPFFGGRVLA